MPIQCEYYALEGLGQLTRNVDLVQRNLNSALEISAIVLVMYDARTRLGEQVASEVRAHFRHHGVPQRDPAEHPAVRGTLVRQADHDVRSELPWRRGVSGTGTGGQRWRVKVVSGVG